jgi:hypothetical protein
MKFIDSEAKNGRGIHHLELTRRNLETLLAKLDDGISERVLVAPGGLIQVRAVEDDAHYTDRDPGTIFMPSTGEYI